MKTILTFVTVCALSALVHAQDVNALLKDADRYRMAADNLQVDTQINTFHADGTPDKERRYTVFAQAGRKSLVLMQSPAEKGQKVLMLGDDFWLLMPGSSRPMRITPMQKLLGDAATGDIATLSWSGDYSAQLAGEEPCDEAAKTPMCLRLHLQATRKGVTYQRIELWLGRARHEPVRADLYVQSDKLAKQARFVMDSAAAPNTVNEMHLTDRLGNGKQTRIRYLSRKERAVPAEWLNPMFLAQNPGLE
ncbi:outer membrane lipoprotein-sorting protein [Ottowia testudinis]|uniref:Outer membrane lipoprotein-sorting protein n=1 Tax=Ottowia testudinis TaxID=2816950 RepID=A0A975CEE9_9BURK|nr:outer membrane lipoprotein-sorting protein [Ottowia testudinis]QTD44019.1 outer membrane lipoprotein-sorting protein [Ottowia testudinis]